MAAELAHSDGTIDAIAAAVNTQLTATSEVRFYTDNTYGTEVVILTNSGGAWVAGAAGTGILTAPTFNAGVVGVGDGNTITHGRVHSSAAAGGANAILAFNVDVIGNTPAVSLSSVAVSDGDTVTMTALTWTAPANAGGLSDVNAN